MHDVKTTAAQPEVRRLDVHDHLVIGSERPRESGIGDRRPDLRADLDREADDPRVRLVDGHHPAAPQLQQVVKPPRP